MAHMGPKLKEIILLTYMTWLKPSKRKTSYMIVVGKLWLSGQAWVSSEQRFLKKC